MSTHHRGIAATLLITAMATSACSAPAAPAPTSPDAATISLTDQRGVEVTIDGPVQAIASAVIPAPTIIAAVDGSWDRIVGINDSLLQANQQGIISTIFPASTSTPVVSDRTFVPNMEQILALDPDVVLQWGDRGEDISAPIEQAGIPVVGLEYGTQEDLETWVALFGTMLDREDRANQIIDTMHSEAASLESQITALDVEPQRALALSYSDEKLSVSTSKDYAQYVFDLTGLTNVAADAQVSDGVVSAEQVIAWDPEIIILSAFDTATPQDVYADPRFADVSAVVNHRVYRAPLGVYRWQVPCAESPLFWNWVAALAYPDQLDIDLPEMMREQISYLYDYELTDDDISLVLRTDLNGVSATYDAVQ